jgi:hypothetical protein
MKRTSTLLAAAVLGAVMAAASTFPASAQKTPTRPAGTATVPNALMRVRDSGLGIDSGFGLRRGMLLVRPNLGTPVTQFRPPTPAMLRQLTGTGVVTAVRGNMLTFRAHNGMTALLRLRSRALVIRAGALMRLQLLSNGFVRITTIQRTPGTLQNTVRP